MTQLLISFFLFKKVESCALFDNFVMVTLVYDCEIRLPFVLAIIHIYPINHHVV